MCEMAYSVEFDPAQRAILLYMRSRVTGSKTDQCLIFRSRCEAAEFAAMLHRMADAAFPKARTERKDDKDDRQAVRQPPDPAMIEEDWE